MHGGSIPFGMSGRQAASYAHKALKIANSIGTEMMMWLAQLLIQMLIESLQVHSMNRRIRDVEAALDRLKELDIMLGDMRQDLETDQEEGGITSGEPPGQAPDDSNAVGPFKSPASEKQREIGLKLKEKHEREHSQKPRHSKHDGPKGP